MAALPFLSWPWNVKSLVSYERVAWSAVYFQQRSSGNEKQFTPLLVKAASSSAASFFHVFMFALDLPFETSAHSSPHPFRRALGERHWSLAQYKWHLRSLIAYRFYSSCTLPPKLGRTFSSLCWMYFTFPSTALLPASSHSTSEDLSISPALVSPITLLGSRLIHCTSSRCSLVTTSPHFTASSCDTSLSFSTAKSMDRPCALWLVAMWPSSHLHHLEQTACPLQCQHQRPAFRSHRPLYHRLQPGHLYDMS